MNEITHSHAIRGGGYKADFMTKSRFFNLTSSGSVVTFFKVSLYPCWQRQGLDVVHTGVLSDHKSAKVL